MMVRAWVRVRVLVCSSSFESVRVTVTISGYYEFRVKVCLVNG